MMSARPTARQGRTRVYVLSADELLMQLALPAVCDRWLPH
jgi:hypothetical protein